MENGQGRGRPDDPVENGDGIRHAEDLEPRNPTPGNDEQNQENELGRENEETPVLEPDPDESEDLHLPPRE